MIVFNLGCDNDHRFEGWFSSSDDFEKQKQEQILTCPLCGSQQITRLPTAARVNTGRAELVEKESSGDSRSQYAHLGAERALRLISHIVENTEDVGRAFPEEARKIHYKESPERHIRGTASSKEVEALRDEGIEVVALPAPAHLTNNRH